MNATLLYDKNKQKLFPATHAKIVDSNADGSQTNVEDCLTSIFSKLSELDGSEEAVSSIIIKVEYFKTAYNTKEEVIENGIWSEIFELPDAANPYIWKKTTYTYKGLTEGKLNETYEIILTSVAEKVQTIYITKSTSSQPMIKYPPLLNGLGLNIRPDGSLCDPEEGPYPKLDAFDDLENTLFQEGWQFNPISVGPGNPYVYMSSRKMNTEAQLEKDIIGKWDEFTTPALFGHWAYDSRMEIRYTTTPISEPVPQVAKDSDDPGIQWKNEPITDFKGKLWMISASSVNGIILYGSNGDKWQGPYLMSIIK